MSASNGVRAGPVRTITGHTLGWVPSIEALYVCSYCKWVGVDQVELPVSSVLVPTSPSTDIFKVK